MSATCTDTVDTGLHLFHFVSDNVRSYHRITNQGEVLSGRNGVGLVLEI